MNNAVIYVLEDDASIRGLEVYALEAAGFTVRGFADAAAFLTAARERPPAVAIVDVMLPGGSDGLEAMKRLYGFSPQTRVIIASAKGDEFDRVKGLDLGADDYLVKPFSMLELASRVKAALRRSGRDTRPSFSSGDVTLDADSHQVRVAGRFVDLTRKEFALLELFLRTPSRVFTREELLARVWSADGAMETRTVDMHVAGLRAKTGRPDLVETVRGVGYRLGRDRS